MTAPKMLFYFCISFIAGIAAESAVKIPQFILWIFLFLFILFFIFICGTLFMRSHLQGIFILAYFCLLFLVLGILRMQIAGFNIANDKLSQLNGSGEIVNLIGIVSNEPDLRDKSQKLKIKIDDFGSTVLATANRYPEFKYLDKVKITGKIETPSETEDFSYKNYLMKDGIYSVMNFPKVEFIEKTGGDPFSVVFAVILKLKRKIREGIRQNFSPPHSSVLEGTVLGDNGAMDKDLKDKLNFSGLRHVIAVSGTHVVILSSIVMFLLLALGFWRGQAFYIAIIFITFYIILTGLPASGIRAGIMGGLYLLAQKLGRQSMGSRVIAIACALMLFLNPLLLFYDVGFQLSFLAVLGMIYLEPIIKYFFQKFIKMFVLAANNLLFRRFCDRGFFAALENKSENLLQIFSATFAAQIFTLPVMIYNFGNISFVSLPANILVLPAVSFLMIFGFLSSVASVFSDILGWVMSFPTYALLNYFVKIIEFFSQPWATKSIENVSWIWLIASYLAIGFLTRFLNIKYRQSLAV